MRNNFALGLHNNQNNRECMWRMTQNFLKSDSGKSRVEWALQEEDDNIDGKKEAKKEALVSVGDPYGPVL